MTTNRYDPYLECGQTVSGGGLTPLMEACTQGYWPIARLLLRCGASVGMKNEDGWTALDFAKEHLEHAELDETALKDAKEVTHLIETKMKQRWCLAFLHCSREDFDSNNETSSESHVESVLQIVREPKS